MFDFWSSLSSVRKRLKDTFSSRSNTSASLGTATDGSRWTPINGVIQVISGLAKSTTTPTELSSGLDYPMAVVSMPTENNTIAIADTEQGSSAALWVQSSTDWWMVSIDSTFNTIPGNFEYGITGSNYGAIGSNYGAVGSNYGATGSNYGATGSNYGITGTNYSAIGTNYGATGTNYGVTGTNYGSALLVQATGSNYTRYSYDYISSYKQNYKYNSSTNYRANYRFNTGYSVFAPTNPINRSYKVVYSTGVLGYTATTNYATGTANQTAVYSNSAYDQATGTNYGYYWSANAAVGNNYGGVGTNYGAVGSNYGATGNNYGAVGSNYGATGSNYSATGSNYGVTGTNYGSVGSNYGVTSTNATTYAYSQYLRIRNSSASVVSTISSALISTTQTIKSLIVQVSGNEITAKAYSDNNFVTQLGNDLVHTASGAVVTTQFGIAISPSAYQQSDIIGSSVTISRV